MAPGAVALAPVLSTMGADDGPSVAAPDMHGGTVGGLTRTGAPFGGVVDDIRRRSKYYLSDWTDGLCWKTPVGALYMFLATFASTVALGGPLLLRSGLSIQLCTYNRNWTTFINVHGAIQT